MTIKQINDTLSLLAKIACSEIEKAGSTNDQAIVSHVNKQLSTLSEDVREHFIDLWICIGRCSEVNQRNKQYNYELRRNV